MVLKESSGKFMEKTFYQLRLMVRKQKLLFKDLVFDEERFISAFIGKKLIYRGVLLRYGMRSFFNTQKQFFSLLRRSWLMIWHQPKSFVPVGLRAATYSLMYVLLQWVLTLMNSKMGSLIEEQNGWWKGMLALELMIVVGGIVLVEVWLQKVNLLLFDRVVAGRSVSLARVMRLSDSWWWRVAVLNGLFLLAGIGIIAMTQGLTAIIESLVSLFQGVASGAPWRVLVVVGLIEIGSILLTMFLGALYVWWMPSLLRFRRPWKAFVSLWQEVWTNRHQVWGTYIWLLVIILVWVVVGLMSNSVLKGYEQNGLVQSPLLQVTNGLFSPIRFVWMMIMFISGAIVTTWMKAYSFLTYEELHRRR